jgi:signal transduction histidine kinase
MASLREVALAEPPASEAQVRGDRALFVRAFTALLETAVKLSHKNESVVWCVVSEDNGSSVTIEATGRTIPEDELPRLFDPFSVTEPITPGGDLGLRLVVAERIVSLFDGSVAAENLDPAGVRFRIELPAAR